MLKPIVQILPLWILVLFLSNSLSAQWVRTYMPETNGLEELHFHSPSEGVMVRYDSTGLSGEILRTTDGGTNWQLVYADTSSSHWINALDFSNDLHGVAVGRWDLTYRTTDGGWTWDTVSTNGTIVYHETIELVDSLIGYTANWRGEILKTTDGGLSWNVIFVTGSMWTPMTDIKCVDADNCVISGWGGIRKTSDGGQTWLYQNDVRLQDMYCWDSLNCIGVGGTSSNKDTVFRTTDGGISWAGSPLPNGISGKCINMIGAEGYIGGGFESILHTLDSGQTWNVVHTRPGSMSFMEINSIQMLDAQHVYACGDSGVFLSKTPSTQVAENAGTLQHLVFPNPSSSQSHISLSKSIQNGRFLLVDARGKVLENRKLKNEYQIVVDLQPLATGPYFYWIEDQKGRIARGRLQKIREE